MLIVLQLLEEIDANTKYVRRVENLTISNDAHSGGTIKEESLTVNQKQESADGSVVYVSRTIRDDPTRPKSTDHIRRNKTTVYVDFGVQFGADGLKWCLLTEVVVGPGLRCATLTTRRAAAVCCSGRSR